MLCAYNMCVCVFNLAMLFGGFRIVCLLFFSYSFQFYCSHWQSDVSDVVTERHGLFLVTFIPISSLSSAAVQQFACFCATSFSFDICFSYVYAHVCLCISVWIKITFLLVVCVCMLFRFPWNVSKHKCIVYIVTRCVCVCAVAALFRFRFNVKISTIAINILLVWKRPSK